MRKKDFWSGLVLVLSALAFLAASLRLPWRDTGYDWFGSPGFVPAILAGFLLLGGTRLMLRSRAGGAFYDSLAAMPNPCACDAPEAQGTAPRRGSEREPALPAWMRSEPLRGALTVALCGAYVFLLMGRIPYIPATFLFLAGFILIFRGAGLPRSGVIGAAASVSIWFVFYKIFAVFLP